MQAKMADGNDKNTDPGQAPDQRWPDVAFDATTNFSMLGWVLDKLTRRNRSKKTVDFSLEE
jgi:hypothetical protein